VENRVQIEAETTEISQFYCNENASQSSSITAETGEKTALLI